MLTAVTIALLVASIITVSVLFAKQNRRGNPRFPGGFKALTDKTATTVISGAVTQPPDVTQEPQVLVNAAVNNSAVQMKLTLTWSGVYIPNVREPAVLSFPLSALQLCGPVEPRSANDVIRFNVTSQTPPRSHTDLSVPLLGLGAGKTPSGQYVNPLFQKLQTLKLPVAWTFGQQYSNLAISLSIPTLSCFKWCWSPMEVTPEGQYIIQLQSPWKAAFVDFGIWASVLPDVTNTSETVVLRTTSGCDITLRPAQYVRGSSPIPILGASAGLENTIFAFDLQQKRFGNVLVVS